MSALIVWAANQSAHNQHNFMWKVLFIVLGPDENVQYIA